MLFSNILLRNNTASSVLSEMRQLNFLLLGKTGTGKSPTANSILGRRDFHTRPSNSLVTTEVKCSQGVYKDDVINVIDTPGFSSVNSIREEEEMITENIKKSIGMSPGGIHAFLFVVWLGTRFTEENRDALHLFRVIFGQKFLETNGIIVFTNGDLFLYMQEEVGHDIRFDEWCRAQKGYLGDLIAECRYRCVLFENRHCDEAAKQKQMNTLVEHVKKFECPYTLEHFLLYSNLHNKCLNLKEMFQREIDNLNLQIDRLGAMENADFTPVSGTLDELTCILADEDVGTGLLNDMKEQLTAVRNKIDCHVVEMQRIQQTARQKNNSFCSIL
ncbi:hypothetical protein BsWGS_23765 [Bradybaena similaris]